MPSFFSTRPPLETSKMLMEVDITSSEIIKPASPTPPHLRTFNLSLLDQLVPQMFITLIYYYPGPNMPTDISRLLKTSLRQILVRFYPLAGRFADESWIDCNDHGVEFNESIVHCRLEDVLRKPDKDALSQLVPRQSNCTESVAEDVLLAVQANFFDCGGLALGVALSHLVGDMASLVTFLNSWASAARDPIIPAPEPLVDLHAALFPQRPGPPRQSGQLPEVPNLIMKSFGFTESNIEALRQKQANGGRPTRVEALSALVCRCMARVTGETRPTSDERIFVVMHAVNLRPRMDPPLPDDTFGNFWLTAATSGLPEGEICSDTEGCLELQLRNAFKKIDGDFLSELQGPKGYEKAVESLTSAMEKHAGKEIELCIFTSWCRFRVYGVDFGWREPEWVSPGPVGFKNAGILVDRKEGDGIEVWVVLNGEEMDRFERDEEILAFVEPPTSSA